MTVEVSHRRPITHDSYTARVLRKNNPWTSYCGRCGYPWNKGGAKPHDTEYDWIDGVLGGGHYRRGCFPLCQDCWEILGSPEARIEYYRDLIALWDYLAERDGYEPTSEETKRDIQRAVANGR